MAKKKTTEAEKTVDPVETPVTEKEEAEKPKSTKKVKPADALALRKFGKFKGKGK